MIKEVVTSPNRVVTFGDVEYMDDAGLKRIRSSREQSPNPKEALEKARGLLKYKSDKEFIGKVLDA